MHCVNPSVILCSVPHGTHQSVSIAMRVHPFPSRTRQLSSSVPTILGGQPPGKIGRRRHKKELRPKGLSSFLFQRHPMSRGLPFGRTVRNIVAPLAWSASRRSLFLPVRRAPFICRRQRGPANPPGKIGRRRHKKATSSLCWLFFYAGVFFCRGLLQPPGKIGCAVKQTARWAVCRCRGRQVPTWRPNHVRRRHIPLPQSALER